MDATEFRIALELDPQTWSLTLQARSKVIGEVEQDLEPLPFRADQPSLFERALDLNDNDRLVRAFQCNRDHAAE